MKYPKDFINKIICGDCLEVMKDIPDNSVDLVVTDLPYGVTQNPNDKPIPLELLWVQYKRIIKENGAIIFTSQFPFTIDLINSNREWFKYDLIWDKVLPSGFLNANRMPLRVHEHILVFYNELPKYNPQFFKGEPSHSKGKMITDVNRNYGEYGKVDNVELHGSKKFPLSIMTFQKPHPSKALHPTQKPTELFEYLVKTYSDGNDVILDNCLGTGTTAVACKKLNRRFIGIEINPEYCKIAEERLKKVPKRLDNILKVIK